VRDLRSLRGPGAWALFAGAALLGWALADGESGIRPWLQLRGDLRAAQVRIASLEDRNAALRRQVEDMKSDPVALERAIREDLELAKPGEVVVLFDPDEAPVPAPSR
jgi:cell division protein FtsB